MYITDLVLSVSPLYSPSDKETRRSHAGQITCSA